MSPNSAAHASWVRIPRCYYAVQESCVLAKSPCVWLALTNWFYLCPALHSRPQGPIPYSIVWRSPCEHLAPQDTAGKALTSLGPDTLELLFEFIDFHDLTLLLCTGDSVLRSVAYQRTRSIRMTGPSFSFEDHEAPILPDEVFSMLSGFQLLTTLVLTPHYWNLPRTESSPLLNLPSSLRHLTISASQSEYPFYSSFLIVPWASHFPTLETLRLFIRPRGSLEDAMPRLGYFVDVEKFPKTLRILSLGLPLLHEKASLMKSLVYPIGHRAATTVKNSNTAKNWNDAWHAYTPTERAQFNYVLPQLEHLELPAEGSFDYSPELTTFELPDLAILPPLLHTLIYICSDAPQRPIWDYPLQTAHTTDPNLIDVPRHSSLTSLALPGPIPEEWMNIAPPTITSLRIPDVTLAQKVLPSLSSFHSSGSYQIPLDAPPVLKNVASMHLAIDTVLMAYFRSVHAPAGDEASSASYSLLPSTGLPYLKRLQECSLEGPMSQDMLQWTLQDLERQPDSFKSLAEISLHVWELDTSTLLKAMPSSVTSLCIHSQMMQGSVTLQYLPPLLKKLSLAFYSELVLVDSGELVHLPQTLHYCRLPSIRLPEATSNPKAEVSSILNALPRGCTFHIRFQSHDGTHVPLKDLIEITKGTAIKAHHSLLS